MDRALREFVEKLPTECAHFAIKQAKSYYRRDGTHNDGTRDGDASLTDDVSTFEGCPLDVHHIEGAPDPLQLEVGKVYDLLPAGSGGGPQPRIFSSYQLQPWHVPKSRKEAGVEVDVGFTHEFESVWFFTSVAKPKRNFYVTAPYRILEHKEVRTASVKPAMPFKQPKSLTSQQDPALALKRHNAAVKAHETRRRLASGGSA